MNHMNFSQGENAFIQPNAAFMSHVSRHYTAEELKAMCDVELGLVIQKETECFDFFDRYSMPQAIDFIREALDAVDRGVTRTARRYLEGKEDFTTGVISDPTPFGFRMALMFATNRI